jgi:hypothetical protein
MKYRTVTNGSEVTFTFPAKEGVSVVLNARDFQNGKQMVAEAIRQAEDADSVD